MKRFVGDDFGSVLLVAVATLMVASLTGADEDGILLIATGFAAIPIICERMRESRT